MGDLTELLLNGCVDVRVGVTVDVRPDRGIAVEVAVSLRIPEAGRLAVGDDQGVGEAGAPLLLAGERVPAVAEIKVQPVSGVGSHGAAAEWPVVLKISGGGFAPRGKSPPGGSSGAPDPWRRGRRSAPHLPH